MKNSFLKLIPAACLFTLFSCSDDKQANIEETAVSDQKVMEKDAVKTGKEAPLKSLLDAKKSKFEENADAGIKKIYKEGIDAVTNSGVLSSAKQVGDVAPNFTLQNAVGESVELSKILETGPVVLTWYRGGWCPYCNITLHQLQLELPNFKAEDATLIALTPELPDSSISTSEKHELEFEVLSDVGNQVAKEYGVVFKLTDEVAENYNNNFDLNAYNGDKSNELPLAATYIINTDGEIVYAFLDADYRNRAEPAVLTQKLKELNK